MVSEPAAVPSACQLWPPSVLDQSPFCATPAMSMSSSGFEKRPARLPHSESMPARFAVALAHWPLGAVPPTDVIPDAPCVPPFEFWPPEEPAAPAAPAVPPAPPGAHVTDRKSTR